MKVMFLGGIISHLSSRMNLQIIKEPFTPSFSDASPISINCYSNNKIEESKSLKIYLNTFILQS